MFICSNVENDLLMRRGNRDGAAIYNDSSTLNSQTIQASHKCILGILWIQEGEREHKGEIINY